MKADEYGNQDNKFVNFNSRHRRHRESRFKGNIKQGSIWWCAKEKRRTSSSVPLLLLSTWALSIRLSCPICQQRAVRLDISHRERATSWRSSWNQNGVTTEHSLGRCPGRVSTLHCSAPVTQRKGVHERGEGDRRDAWNQPARTRCCCPRRLWYGAGGEPSWWWLFAAYMKAAVGGWP